MVIGTCTNRHRHQEWIKFLKLIDGQTDPDLDIHLIVDNYATHKHDKVKKWLKRHPRFHVHFIPTSSSWLNVIERWFRDITDQRLKRGVFKNVPDVVAAISGYIDAHSEDPNPIIWSATADKILEKVGRARPALENLQTD